MIGSAWVRCCDAASSWIGRLSPGGALLRPGLAVAAALTLATTPSAAGGSDPGEGSGAGALREHLSPAGRSGRRTFRAGSGAGALVEYETTQVVDGRPITAAVRVFVVVPGDPAQPTYLAVGVNEVDTTTGAELFAGTGTGAPGKFTVGEDFANARVTGRITVLSATPGATRIVDLDVVWSPLDSTQKIKLNGRGGRGGAAAERHTGAVRRMTGVGLVEISDPSDPSGTSYTITTPGLGCAWDTEDTSRDAVPGPSSASGASTSGTVTASTTGYWSGYWTWSWDGTKWTCHWTWVYYYPNGTYSVS